MSEHYSLEDECAKQCKVVYLFKLLRRCGTKQALLWAKWGYFCGNVPADTSAVTHKAQEKEFFHLWLVARPDPAAQLRQIMVAVRDSYFPAKKQIVTRYIQGHLPRCIQRLYMVIIHNKILCRSPQLKGGCMVLFLWSLSLVFMGLYTFRQGKGAKIFITQEREVCSNAAGLLMDMATTSGRGFLQSPVLFLLPKSFLSRFVQLLSQTVIRRQGMFSIVDL